MLCKTPFIWFRLFRRQTYPWTMLAIATCEVIYLCGTQQDKEKIRLMVALAKIDFVKFYAFINDLLW